MEQVSETLETGVDRLLRLVQERGEITLTAASNTLRVDRTVVEAWTDLLEEAGQIDTSFTLNQRHLCSKKHNKLCHQNRFSRVFKRYAKSVTTEDSFNAEELKRKKAEIDEAMGLLEERLSEMDKYKRGRDALDAAARSLEEDRERLEREKAEFATLNERFGDRVRKTHQRTETIQQREAEILDLRTVLTQQTRAVQNQERALAEERKRLDHARLEVNTVVTRLLKVAAPEAQKTALASVLSILS